MRIWYTTPPRVGVRNFRNTTDPPPLSLRYSGGGRSLSGGVVSVGSPPGVYLVHLPQGRKRSSPGYPVSWNFGRVSLGLGAWSWK